MITACEKAGVRLMIAYQLHFAPAHLQSSALARAGKLGELRFFSSIFGMQVKADNISTDPKDGGGPLRDLGVYCINAARYLFGAEPSEVRAPRCRSAEPRHMSCASYQFWENYHPSNSRQNSVVQLL